MIYKAEEKFHSYYLGKCNQNLCAQKLNCQIDQLASALTQTQALPLSLLPNKKWEGQEYFNFYSKVMSFGLFSCTFSVYNKRKKITKMHVDVVVPWEVSLQSTRVWKNNYSRNETVSYGYLQFLIISTQSVTASLAIWEFLDILTQM